LIEQLEQMQKIHQEEMKEILGQMVSTFEMRMQFFTSQIENKLLEHSQPNTMQVVMSADQSIAIPQQDEEVLEQA